MSEPAAKFTRHHTKDKGDLGVARVIADLAKVSVTYLTMASDGILRIPGQSGWTDRHGVHKKLHQPGDYDGVAVCCPTTERCYYVPAAELRRKQTALRILETRNQQQVGVRMADQFTDPQKLFPSPRSSAG